MSLPAVALFARAPVAGQVKTRLIPALGAQAACEVHRALVLDAWDAVQGLRPGCEIFLYSDQDHPEWRQLAGAGLRFQRGRDLGERMVHCFQEMAAAGHTPLLIVGSDTVGLSSHILSPWTRCLRDAAALLGPAEDGGYWAIGCRQPHPNMLEGVEWSSKRTLEATGEALARCGMPPAFLETLWDLDQPEDLDRLADMGGPVGRRLRTWMDQTARRNSRKRRA